MKNRNCPNKDACRSYNASNCEGCVIGEKFSRLTRQIEKLKAEKKEAEYRAEVADRAVRWIAFSEYEYENAIRNAKMDIAEEKMSKRDRAKADQKEAQPRGK